MKNAISKTTKNLSSLAQDPLEYAAFAGKSRTLIWIGDFEFRERGRVLKVFAPDELQEFDRFVITGRRETLLLRGGVLYPVRLFNIGAHLPANSGPENLFPFQRCVWNDQLTSCSCAGVHTANRIDLIKIDINQINAWKASCEILPACDDGSEWRMLAPYFKMSALEKACDHL